MEHSDCIFCKIAAGQIPAKVLYQDEQLIAFMDINAVNPGHALVCPKAHSVNMADAPEEILGALAARAKAIGLLQMERLGATGFNLVVANGKDAQQSVFHLHFHIVPRYPSDGIDMWFHGRKGSESVEASYAKLRGQPIA